MAIDAALRGSSNGQSRIRRPLLPPNDRNGWLCAVRRVIVCPDPSISTPTSQAPLIEIGFTGIREANPIVDQLGSVVYLRLKTSVLGWFNNSGKKFNGLCYVSQIIFRFADVVMRQMMTRELCVPDDHLDDTNSREIVVRASTQGLAQ